MRQILSSWSIKNFKRTAIVRILLSALLLSALQAVAVSVSPIANAAAPVSPEPYGLNYKRNYFEVSGGLSPSNSNFTVGAYVRVNANVPSGDTPESMIIIGNAGGGMIVKIVSLSPAVIYIGEAWSSSTQFTCSSNISLKTWYQVTVVQDAIGSGAWLNGVSCGTRGRTGYSAASQVGGQSSPPRFTLDSDIASLIFSNQALFAYNASSIPVPAPDAANPAGTTFSLKTNSIKAKDGTGNHTLTAVSNGGSITASQVFLVDQSIAFGTSSYSIAYGATQQLSISGTSGTGAVTYSAGSSTACSVGSTGLVNVTAATGTCSISASIAADSIYSAATTTTPVTITVGPASSTIVVTGSNTFTYTGSAQGPSSSTVTGSTGLVTYSYSGSGSTSYGPSTTKPTNVGTYTTTASVAASGNYATASSAAYSFNISQASQVTSPAITSTVGTFGANLTLTTSGGSGGGTNSFAVNSGPCTVLGSTLSATAAGTCMVTATQAANGNYLAASSLSTEIIINKATPTFTWNGVSTTYGASTFDLVAPTSNTQGTWSYSSANTSVISLNGSSATATGYGTSLITATFTPGNETNYLSGETKTMTITSAKAEITVTPLVGQSKAYGANNPSITYSITSGSLIGTDTLTGSLAYTGSNVGSYPITIGSLANSSYIITLASGNFSITQATQNAVSLSSLSTSYNPGNKTISLTGSGGSGTGSYTYALDSSNATPGCSVSGSTLTYTTAGTCIVAVTRSGDTNYLFRTDLVSFSIGITSQTITFGALSAKEYSGDTFTVSATSSASLPVVFTSVSQLVCTTSGSYGSTIKLLGVGTCVINANQIGDGNVAAASQVSQDFSVDPRAITVTADAKSKIYGTNDPTLTYSITTGSLVLGDSLTGMLTRPAGSDAGTYEIQQGSLTTANNPKYAITFVRGDLTIDRATPALVLSYPNSNVSILRPGAIATPAVATSSSLGALTYATTSASSICTVNSATGVVSLFGAGNCAVAMTTAQTTNFTAYTQTTTLTVALLSTSLVGIDPNDLISMGQPFYSHPVINQSYSFSSGSNGASVSIPAGTLDSSVPISVSLLTDSAEQRALIGGTGTAVLSVVVSWVASDGSVPNTNTGKAISVTLTNPEIKAGAKIYSIIGDQSQLLGTAVVDGSVTTFITEDPVLLVINPVAVVNVPVVSVPVDTAADAALNPPKKIVPQLSLYSVTGSLQLSNYDKAALKKYVSTLKKGSSVKCIGYSYAGKVSKAKATKLAKSQANSVCNLMKSYKKGLKTSVVIYDAKKAPRAAKGAKWVAVSFRVDGTTK
jgi:hypothetical protein